MNLQIEKDFVKKFVKKELHERIIYELTSAKYRHKALQRFSSVDSCILKPNCIALKNTKVDLGDIAEKYINKLVYYMDEFDGGLLPINLAIRECKDNYMCTIIILDSNNALVKTEVEFGSPLKILLKYAE